METLVARHIAGDQFAIDVRGHRVVVDQPASLGGDDTAPTPTELFVAGLASCISTPGVTSPGTTCPRRASR